ncbi:hypothetical protein BVX99_02550 [bacterium F16]|nr:hypothetical protein BVX99_02550 [bacterium F16]
MKKNVIIVIIVAVMAGVGWYGYQQKQKRRQEMAEKPTNGITPPRVDPGKNEGAGEPVEPVTKPRPQSAFYKAPNEEAIPPGWEDFYELSQMEKLNKVTRQMHRKRQMDSELYNFLKGEMFNRNHWDVTRNNIANALIWTRNDQNQHPDPDLHEAFITMLEDETEDSVWRDYCLQFLSENYQNSSDPQRVMGVITTFSKGDDSIAGTAVLHMALQERDGAVKLDENFGNSWPKSWRSPRSIAIPS